MTGRELVLFILMNGLEDVRMPGWVTVEEFAENHNVGVATVRTWIKMERVNVIVIQEKVYINENSYVGDNHEQ